MVKHRKQNALQIRIFFHSNTFMIPTSKNQIYHTESPQARDPRNISQMLFTDSITNTKKQICQRKNA